MAFEILFCQAVVFIQTAFVHLACDAFTLLFTQRLIFDEHKTTSPGLIFPFLCIRMRCKVRAACMEWRVHFAAAATAMIITGETRFMLFHSTQLLILFSVSFTLRLYAMCTILYVHVFVSAQTNERESMSALFKRNGLGSRYYISTTVFFYFSPSRRSFYFFRLNPFKQLAVSV